MFTVDMVGITLNSYGNKVLSLSDKRNEIIDALDFLVNGF